jgi:hypothetical protein
MLKMLRHSLALVSPTQISAPLNYSTRLSLNNGKILVVSEESKGTVPFLMSDRSLPGGL